MSQVTEQSVRFQTALASIKLIQASAVLDLTEDDFDFLTSNKVWIATDRSRARRCVEACVYGTLDFVGYPRFPAPVEFIAAVIAYYVHPVNKIGRAVQQECRDRDRMPSSASKKQITPRPRTRQPHPQHLSRFRLEGSPHLHRFSIQRRSEIRTRQRNVCALGKRERPAQQRHLQCRSTFRVAGQTVSEP